MTGIPTTRTIKLQWTAGTMAGGNVSRVIGVGETVPFLASFENDLAVGGRVQSIGAVTVSPPSGLAINASVVCGGVQLDPVPTVAGSYLVSFFAYYDAEQTQGAHARIRMKVVP
jgi:hypothetical protein